MDGDSRSSWLPWIVAVFLLLGAAYFAVAETAFASASRNKIKNAADKGDSRAEKALYVLDHFDRAISTLLIGTNIVHIAAASLVTVAVTRLWGLSAVSVSTIVTTIVVFFAGEMLPKSIAKKYPERLCKATAGTLRFFMVLFWPLSSLLTLIGRGAAALTPGEAEISVTEDELYDIIETMTDEGELDEERGELIHSALEFGDVTVERVFTPRVDMAALAVTEAPEAVLDFIRRTRHSRIPVYEGTIDNIIGVLPIRRYIRAYIREGRYPELRAMLDEPCFVHQSATIDELLEEMTRRKCSLAVVTDNYGGTVGIITVEDILEELVGEIWDEEDVAREDFRPLGDGRYEVSPDMDMEDLLDKLGCEDPEDTDWDHKPLGEWVYEQFDMIPSVGDSFTWHRLCVTVSAIENRRILKLLVTLLPEEPAKGGEEK